MNRRFLLLFFAVALVMAAPVHAQPQQTLLNFTGFDYEDPGDGGTYLAVGDGYKSVGFVTSVGPLIQSYVDFDNNQYTYYLFDLTVNFRDFDGDNLVCLFDNNARVRYFEDPFARPYTPALYGTTPPPGPSNPTSPSTFIDPSPPMLGGDLDDFVMVYTFSTGQGSWSGSMTLDEGAEIGNVPIPQRSGWLLGAQAGPPNPSVPNGYDNQVEGNCVVPGPTPARHRTWGAIKSLYRH